MTSNQVQAQLGYINAQETNRHNIRTEELGDEENRLKQLQISNEDWYKHESTRIQEKYNDAYMAYLNASLEWKSFYEGQLADIEAEKLAMEEEYKTRISSVEEQKANLQELMLAETSRANLANEDIKRYTQMLTERDQQIKQTELRNQLTITNLNDATKKLQLAQEEKQHQEKLALESQALLFQYQNELAKRNQEAVNNATQAGVSLTSTLINGLFNLGNMVTGRRR